MRSAAFAEALRRGAGAWPILTVDWMARGLDLGRGIYSTAIRATSLGQVSAVTEDGTGWSEISYGSGIRSGTLEAVTWSVKVSDPGAELFDMLETYNPRGSAARADWGVTGLVAEDWEPLARGVVADWAREEPFTKLLLKTDDTVLRTPVPSGLVARTEWGTACDSSIFSTALPLILGIHDLSSVTARGSVPLVNLRYDEVLGYWWGLSSSNMAAVDRLYIDGLPVGSAGWSVQRGVYGSAFWTLVVFAAGYQPAKDAIVSCDCKGPNELGGYSGSALTGPPDQLRAILEEWVYRTPPLGVWRGATSIIDDESWDAASEYFALHRFESARRLGADQNVESAAELIQSFLDSYPFTRIHWNELGKLEFVVIDPDDFEPDSSRLELDLHHADGRVPFCPGDAREVYTQVRSPFGFSAADQKFVFGYEAHDVAALPEEVVLTVENVWSQVRLRQDVSDLNPAPPADPEIPT